MASNFSTGVPSLDAVDIKESLKTFLEGQTEFNSFNFEGSAISTILDLLTKNTHYLSYVANMMARESFLGRAQIRKNIVEHAQRLSYLPGSKTCAKAVVDIVITPDAGTAVYPQFITMSPNTLFSGQYSSEVVNFANQDEYALYLNASNNTYSRTGVEIFQGDLIQEVFTYASGNDPSFTLSNSNVDITTLKVTVQNSATDTKTTSFSKVDDITEVGSGSDVYFLYENGDGKYRAEFGDGVLGKSLVNGNIVSIEYMAVNSDVIANGIQTLTLISDIEGFVDGTVTVTTPSYGGSDREDEEQIRRWAPLGWEAQDRSVTTTDYTVNLKKLFPQAKSAVAWGGEDNTPPRYGSVFIAINTLDGSLLVDTVKEEVKKLLKKTNIGPITPIIVDPEYVDMDLTVSIGYDSIVSKTSINDEFSAISNLCVDFSNIYLEDFERHFVSSELIVLIKDRNAVVSADLTFTIAKTLPLIAGAETTYTVYFNNPVEPGTLEARGFKIYPTDSDTRIYDDGNGVVKVDRLDTGVRKVLIENAGTIDYTTGIVSFTILPISIDDPDGNISISVQPSDSNVLAEKQDILRISNISVVENTKLRRG